MLDSVILEPGDIVAYSGMACCPFHIEVEKNDRAGFSGTVIWVANQTCHYQVGAYGEAWGKQFFMPLEIISKLKKFDLALNKLEKCLSQEI